MQIRLKLTVAAGIAAIAGIAFAQQEQVVRIGHVAPMSGPQAHYGKDNENGVRMAIEDLNKQGVIIGGKKLGSVDFLFEYHEHDLDNSFFAAW